MIIELENERGALISYGVLSIFSVNDEEYIALVPMKNEDEPANADVLLYGLEDADDDDYSLYEIEDDEEYQTVSEAFQELVQSL